MGHTADVLDEISTVTGYMSIGAIGASARSKDPITAGRFSLAALFLGEATFGLNVSSGVLNAFDGRGGNVASTAGQEAMSEAFSRGVSGSRLGSSKIRPFIAELAGEAASGLVPECN